MRLLIKLADEFGVAVVITNQVVIFNEIILVLNIAKLEMSSLFSFQDYN